MSIFNKKKGLSVIVGEVKKIEQIEITKDNIKKIDYDFIIAVAIAENGAMGEPGGFQAIDGKLRLYHSNIATGEVSYNELVEKFRLLKGFNCGTSEINNKRFGWKWYNLGGGNALLIREKYYKVFNDEVLKRFGENYKKTDLYQCWVSIIEEIVDKVDDDPWWFSFDFNSIDEIIEYLKVNNEATSHVNSRVDENGTTILNAWIDYDMGLFRITKFLKENQYVFEKYYNNEKYLYLFHQPLKLEDIDKFDIEKVSYLILRCFNIERICEGTIKYFLESGILLRLVERAKEIKGENNEL